MTRILKALKQLGSPASAPPSTYSPEPSTENHDPEIASDLEPIENLAPSEVAERFEDQVLANNPENTSIVGPSTDELPGVSRRSATQFEQTIKDSLDDPRLEKQYYQIVDRVFENLGANQFTSVLVCCSSENETCSSFSTHFGAAVAKRDKARALVVDVDRKQPSLSSELACDREQRFLAVDDKQTNLYRIVHGTMIEGLYFLAFGPCTSTDSAAAVNGFAALLQHAQRKFKVVVINGGNADNAKSIVRLCDSCFLHVEFNKTTAAEACEAENKLRSAGARLLGCVANDS